MDNFNLQDFVKKSKNEFYNKLYEGKKEHSMEEEMHDDVKEEKHDDIEEGMNSDRIEGLLNIPLKAKFLNAGVELINDFLEEELMDLDQIIAHLANELEKEYVAAGEHDTAIAIDEEKEEDPHEMDEEIVKEISLNVSDVEAAMSFLGGALGLPAVAYLSAKAQEKLQDLKKSKNKEVASEGNEKLEEISLNVSDVEAAMSFLGGALGLPAVAFLSAKAQEKLQDLKKSKDKKELKEEDGDEIEIEDTIEVPAEDVADVEMEAPEGEAEDNKEIFAKLVDAYESAKLLGDDKLTRQLANTITYFNKSVIFGDEG